MTSSRTSFKSTEADQAPKSTQSAPENKYSKMTPRNILSAIGSRLFSQSQENTEAKKQRASSAEKQPPVPCPKDRTKAEERISSGMRMKSSERRSRNEEESQRKDDRDLRRFRTRYNTGMGNIMRNWMSLIYCILILRMNLIKFILEKFPGADKPDNFLYNQVLLESRTVYNMIRKAQNYSQERALYLWMHLEKVIFSRMFLKNFLNTSEAKELELRDWKGAGMKLELLQVELENSQNMLKCIQKAKHRSDAMSKEKVMKLQALTNTKNAEMDHLIEQITECKKREVQMRGRILLNLKSCKDLKTKQQHLMNVEKELNALKADQNAMVKEYNSKIQALKTQIEEKEDQIKMAKEERRKLRAGLESFGDFTDRKSVVTLEEA